MVRVRVRHLNVVDAELKAAADEALRITIPIVVDKDGRLQTKGGGASNSTESRWLGRMVTNTLGEVRARADPFDTSGALLDGKVASEREEVEKLQESKKRKRADVSKLQKQAAAARQRVLKKVEAQCTSEQASLRPAASEAAEAPAPAADKAASRVLAEVPALGAQAKRCMEQLGAASDALGARIDSFRQTAGAVTSFLASKPSRVDEAIRASTAKPPASKKENHPGGAGASGNGSKHRGKEAGGAGGKASGVSVLAEHMAPAAAGAATC